MRKIFTPEFKKQIIDFGQSVIVAIVICIFIITFVAAPNEVDGTSMQPNYATGDRLYTNRLSHWVGSTPLGSTLGLNYKRGDVVVVEKPGVVALIKRIVGMPGETLKIFEGKVYINGKELQESYLPEGTITSQGTFLKENVEVNIPEGNYFVMGDNRRVSSDSRYIGLIETDWLQGKIFLRIWPLNEIEIVPTGVSTLK
ncbi:MAG: signal peptidase I [Candidatus Dojkabacteria bacterium]